jgi:hypothetical protein
MIIDIDPPPKSEEFYRRFHALSDYKLDTLIDLVQIFRDNSTDHLQEHFELILRQLEEHISEEYSLGVSLRAVGCCDGDQSFDVHTGSRRQFLQNLN